MGVSPVGSGVGAHTCGSFSPQLRPSGQRAPGNQGDTLFISGTQRSKFKMNTPRQHSKLFNFHKSRNKYH